MINITITCDYKTEMINAIKTIFPKERIVVSFFHYIQWLKEMLKN